MSNSKPFLLTIAFFAALIMFSSMYIVSEGEQALLLRLGKIITEPGSTKASMQMPGLHFKIPLITTARVFDIRLNTLDIKSSRIVTEEKKDVLVDYYIKWRISDVPFYYTRTSGNSRRAEALLEQKLNDGLRAEFGKRNITDVVSGERVDIMSKLQEYANAGAQSLGIDVIDVRIKRIDLPTEVSAAVYDRMRAEREQIANEHRAKGNAEAGVLQAQADARATVIIASADSTAKILRGEGDAIAAQIYAKAYNQDPEFYAFYRSLLAYQEIFKNKNDVLVLQPDSHFFKYFVQSGANSGKK